MLAYSSSKSIQDQGVNSVNAIFNLGTMPQPSAGINNFQKTPETTRFLFILSNEIIPLWQVNQSLAIQGLFPNRFKEMLSLVGEIRRYIEFRDNASNEIPYFLKTNSQLIPLIYSSIPVIKDFFPGYKLAAELLSDPESEIQNQKMVIYIKTSLSAEDTIRRLEEFDHKWGNNIYLKSDGKILVMEEFE